MARLPRPLALLRDRITFSTLTKVYFAFSMIHFAVQVSIQIRAFTINHKAEQSLAAILAPTQVGDRDPSPFLQGSTLRMCYWVPSNLNVDVDSCPIVWQGKDMTDQGPLRLGGSGTDYALSSPAPARGPPSASTNPVTQLNPPEGTAPPLVVLPTSDTSPSTTVETITVTATPTPRPGTPLARPAPPQLNPGADEGTSRGGLNPADDDDDDEDDDEDDEEEDDDDGITVLSQRLSKRQSLPPNWTKNITANISYDGEELSSTCLWTLQYPLAILRDTKREDIVFIAFHFWVLGMSIVALLNESIPHVLASLVTHAMATAWAGFQISHTASFKADFVRVIASGACQGAPLLPGYWRDRSGAEISSLALNAFALLLSGLLTWKMIKLFGWQTFKRVGASRDINRIYKLVLTLSITIQLSLFFMIVTVSLWIDQLFNKVIGDLGSLLVVHKALSFVTLVLLIPWLMTGWFAVRRELRVPMFVFLALSVLYLGGWGLMFFSTTFRWTFITWRFFAVMASASVALTFASAFLGVICLYNFGKGLARYLNAHRVLLEDDLPSYGAQDSKYPADSEKITFPTSQQPIPTYFQASQDYNQYTHQYTQPMFDYNSPTNGNKESPFLTPPPPAALPLVVNDAHGDAMGHGNGGVGGFPTRSNSFGSTKSSSSSTAYSAGSWESLKKSVSGGSNHKGKQEHSRTGSQTSSQGKRWVIE